MLISRLPGLADITPADPSGFARQLGETLARIHATTHNRLAGFRRVLDRPEGSRAAQRGPAASLVTASWEQLTAAPSVLTHHDYWSGNTVWKDGALTGVADWTGGALGPRGFDLGWCRLDLYLLFGQHIAARYSGPKASDLRRARTGPAAAVCPVPDRWTGAVTDHIVVGDRIVLDASFRAARARLEILARGGMLLRASEVAYGEGITGLVKLAGPAAGLTRLAGVRLDDLAHTYNCAHIPLQWEAIAADGKLFTALDADLMLVPAGDQIAALALAGAYRPQPGRAGAELDRAIARRCATAAIASFMAQVASALVHPAGTAGPAGRSPLGRPLRNTPSPP